jgi:2-keto-4-pentenoate hydratase
MSTDATPLAAAREICSRWQQGTHGDDLSAAWRPADRAAGYAIQACCAQALADEVAGWKIAATSTAGQQHIRVSGPLAGPVFRRRVKTDGAIVSLQGNAMRVAECEVVFRLGRSLAPRAGAWGVDEVLAAVDAILPGIEVPDSRFAAFERAGEAQLIADCACSHDMLLGQALAPDARLRALSELRVQAQVSDGRQPTGLGSNVLGDPLLALVWLVNELTGSGRTLQAGQFVTTGACVPPIPVLPGHRVQADFGWLGRMSVSFA